ncbi:MAG TPA: hypothetical protein VM782_18035, partial [Stellaceae bacterium]|nr:hypothetical protein [Stellaceae bacterium]
YGTISGPGLDAIRELSSGNLTVNNFGTISGGHSVLFGSGNANRLIAHPGAAFQGGVAMNAGGTLTVELASAASAGTIGGFGGTFGTVNAIKVDSGAQWTITGANSLANGVTLTDLGTLTNAGTITGSGKFIVDPTTFTNPGYMGVQVRLAAGSGLSNTSTGTIKVAGTAVYGYGAPATVVNAGTIEGTGGSGVGLYLKAGGSIANTGTAALISGGEAIDIQGAVGTVTNSGTITGLLQPAVVLGQGGSIANNGTAALISGYTAVYIKGGAGTVSNAGTLKGTGLFANGVYLKAAGSVVNSGTGALISGGIDGVKIAGGDGVVTNAGTISGGTDAVLFGSGNDRLIVDPGAKFVGNVDGAAGTNVLELASGASTGTISGLGTKYLNFSSIVVDPGANWVVSGSSVPPVTVGAGAYVDNAGTLTSSSGPVSYYQPGFGFIFVGPVAVYGTGSAVTAVNTGTISSGGYPHTAIFLGHGGSVANIGTAAYISAYTAGIRIGGGAGTVSNAGTLKGTG